MAHACFYTTALKLAGRITTSGKTELHDSAMALTAPG